MLNFFFHQFLSFVQRTVQRFFFNVSSLLISLFLYSSINACMCTGKLKVKLYMKKEIISTHFLSRSFHLITSSSSSSSFHYVLFQFVLPCIRCSYIYHFDCFEHGVFFFIFFFFLFLTLTYSPCVLLPLYL